MRNLHISIIGLCLIILSASAYAQIPEQVLSTQKTTESIMIKLAEKNYQGLGFDSFAEAKIMETNKPIREFSVRLDELKQYKTSSDPIALLKGGDEYIFPVMVKGKVKSSFTVVMAGDTVMPVPFGSPNRIQLIMNALNMNVSDKRPVEAFFLVKVPALYYHFLGYKEGNKLFLIPLLNDSRFKYSAAKPLPAENVFENLVVVASEDKYLKEVPGKK
jgi:hypothetical protein